MDYNAMAQWLLTHASGTDNYYGPFGSTGATAIGKAVAAGDAKALAAALQADPSTAQRISGDPNYSSWNLTNSQTNQLNQNQASQQTILNNMQQYATELQKPLDPNDPLYKSVMSAAANAGGGAAEAQGINGPLASANVESATAGALANTELQRQGMAAQLMGQSGQLALGGGQLALGGVQTGMQAQYNNAAIAQANSPMGFFQGIAGQAIGALTGAATGKAGGRIAQSVNGLSQAPPPPTMGFSSPTTPSGGGGNEFSGGFSRGSA